MTERYHVDKIAISVVNIDNAVQLLSVNAQKGIPGYVCVTNSRTAYLANHNPLYCKIQNNSFLTLPDGAPLVWIAHSKGFTQVGKVSGKDLMDAIFLDSQDKGYSHYFFGSTHTTLSHMENKLLKDYPDLHIIKMISPPFQPLESFDVDGIANELNQLKPDYFWCGLGAPKQEQFMALLAPKLNKTICVGVGLAFEYYAGTVRRSPRWMQKTGLEWSYRLAQQPQNISRATRPLFWILRKTIQSLILRK